MGTTCETLVLLPQGALLAHVGDSRIYRLRGDKLHQLTFDHSLVWEMRAAGQISDDSDVASAIPKNVITRSLGPNPKVKVDIEGPYPTAVGDTFLICSDGLTGRVEDQELGAILANLSPKEAGQILIDLANLRGGPDNITVVIAKVTGPEMTTRVAQAEPLTVGGNVDVPTTVHPALWVVTGVCFLAAIVMAALDQVIPALLAGVGGAIALAIGLIQKFGTFATGGVTLSGQRRLGRGPYVEVTCAANQEMADNLASLTSELYEAAEGQVPSDGIAAVDRQAAEAAAARERGDFPAAVRQSCQVISHIMRLLREQRDTGATSDSTVDL
jgi:protein phosphatase